MALISSMDEQDADLRTAYIGEVGLSGELRPVSQMQERVNEAEKLGFERIVVPKGKKNLRTQKAQISAFVRIQDLVS